MLKASESMESKSNNEKNQSTINCENVANVKQPLLQNQERVNEKRIFYRRLREIYLLMINRFCKKQFHGFDITLVQTTAHPK